jgi:hypothetical protein
MHREEIYGGLEPQMRRPISNLFGDTHLTYLGQTENQENALQMSHVQIDDGVPLEFVRAYAMLSMNAGLRKGLREISRNVLLILVVVYFVPSWVVLIFIPLTLYSIYYSQKSYRKALALADQFYDRTIYRYEGLSSANLSAASDVVKRVIQIG